MLIEAWCVTTSLGGYERRERLQLRDFVHLSQEENGLLESGYSCR